MTAAPRTWLKFVLRISPEMKRWVEDQAQRNFTSQNTEILRSIQERIERTPDNETAQPDAPTSDRA